MVYTLSLSGAGLAGPRTVATSISETMAESTLVLPTDRNQILTHENIISKLFYCRITASYNLK